MVHHATNDGRIEQLFYLRIRPDIIKLPGVMITNEVSNQSGVIPGPVSDMLDNLDLEVIYRRMVWSDPVINTRLQAADRYEVLIPDCVPTEYILN
jgi:hypothetical protein